MPKLRGAKKEAFLKRMAAGRRKAAKGKTPKRKPAKKKAAAKKRNLGLSTPSFILRPNKSTDAAVRRFHEISTGFWRKLTARQKAELRSEYHKHAGKATRKNAGKRQRRRNQEGDANMEDAAATFEMFHQSKPRRTIEYATPYTYPTKFAELGKLKELRFDLDPRNKNFPLTHFGNCMAVVTPDGSNIYFLGGDQKIDLAALDIASDKDFVELGPCTFIMYHTQKGFHDFEPIDYYHRFGEEDGILPNLVYDRLNQALFLVSGNYRVRADGIEN